MYASGSSIDCLTYASSGLPALLASAFRWSRSGPTFPAAFAGVKVWQAPHVPGPVKSAAAAAFEPPPPAAPLPPAGAGAGLPAALYQLSKPAAGITIALDRISAWPRPQSSVQITG